MKPLLAFIMIFTCSFFIITSGFNQQNADQLFQSGLYKEEIQGELEQAIEVYQTILNRFSDNRIVAAKALLHIGLCYEKQGKNQAQKAYLRIIQEFTDQQEVVAEARVRLTAIQQINGTKKAKVRADRKVWALSGEASPVSTISSDGHYLTFQDNNTGNLGIRDLRSGENRLITNEGSWSNNSSNEQFYYGSAFSPDGKQIAYNWYVNDRFELRLVNLEGSEPRILYRNDEVRYPGIVGWFPDGEKLLAIFQREDYTFQIVQVSVADGSVRVLRILDNTQWEGTDVSLSPDGRYIVYSRPQKEDSSKNDIFLFTLEDNRDIPLVEHPAHDFGPLWAPDGKRIMFTSDRSGEISGWIIHVENGKLQGSPELVKDDIGKKAWGIGFTQDGTFYYCKTIGTQNVYSATLDPKTGDILVPPKLAVHSYVGYNLDPVWSPDGKYFAYTTRRGPNYPRSKVITIRNLENGQEREITPQMSWLTRPRWSPDGKSFLGCGNKDQDPGLYQINLQTGSVSTIDTSNIWRAEWSPDGKSIFYSYGANKIYRIMRLNLTINQKEELIRENKGWIDNLAISPDGKHLAYSLPDSATSSSILKTVSIQNKETNQLLRVKNPEYIPGGLSEHLTWTPDGRYVIFVKGKEDLEKQELWRIPWEGGEPVKLGVAMEGIGGLCIHPGGQQIAFYAGSLWSAEIWAMENFLPEFNESQ